MQKFLWMLSAAVMLTTFTACEEGLFLSPDDLLNSSVVEIALDALPDQVVETAQDLFPNANIVEALSIQATDQTTLFSLSMSNGEEMTMQTNGQRCNDTLSIDSLPAAIQAYVDTAYAGELILKAAEVVKSDGSVVYIVHLSSGEVLAFDHTGAFLGERPKKGRKHRGSRDNRSSIDPADLPAAVSTALASDYPSNTVDKAIELTLPDGSIVYLMKLDDGTHVAYDAAGTELVDFRPSWRQARRFCQGNSSS